MNVPAGSFLSGLSADEREWLENSLEHRLFPEGSIILAEGDAPREMYIITSGLAEVTIVDPFEVEHRISGVGPGDSIGEMSILTGQPVSATVRAATDVEVLVLPRVDFANMVTEFPQLYLNLGTILSTRLARTNRRAIQQRRGRVSILNNQGAPSLLGYALACSVAWHIRRPTLFLICSDREPDPELQAFLDARQAPEATGGSSSSLEDASDDTPPGAVVLVTRPENDFSPERIRRTIEDLCDRYAHVLIEMSDPTPLTEIQAKRVTLIGPEGQFTRPDSGNDSYALQGWSEPTRVVGPGTDGILRIAAPCQAELDDLKQGALPLGEHLGRAIGWAARDIAGQKVGLALGAGSIKGYAHVGVLHMLERRNIPVDYVAGTSIGGALAASYALGFPPATCERIMDQIGKRAFRLAVPRHGLLSNSGLREGIRRVSKDRRIESSRIPLAIVAADINTGREVVLKKGLIWPAVLASMAIPGIYPPVPMGDYMLVDGGVVNPVPSDAVSGMGADIVIAVKLARREDDRAFEAVSIEPSSSPPLILQTITRSIEIMQGKIVTESAAAATIAIEPTFPETSGWGLRTFGQGGPFIEVGQAAAESALPRLAAAMPWLRD
ncbi:hypothetical protein BH23CHL2_BH23CHL2_06570 [soil metagenome]